MEKKLSFNEVLPMEELAPVELDAIVGGNAIKIIGAKGDNCEAVETQHKQPKPPVQHLYRNHK